MTSLPPCPRPMSTRSHHRAMIWFVVPLVGVVVLAGCGGGSDSSPEPKPSESVAPSIAPADLGQPVAMETVDGGPDPARIAELLDVLASADISTGTVELADCPLGSAAGVFAAFPEKLTKPTELPGRVDPYNSFSDDGPGGICMADGSFLSFEAVPDDVDEGQILAASTQYRPEISTPIDLFGGRAYTACDTSDEEIIRCRAAWYGEGLQVSADVSSYSADAAAVAAWFSAALPVMLGGSDLVEAATPFNIEGPLALQDPEGYTLAGDYSFSASSFVPDPTNSPPGSTELVISTQGSVTLTNTTEGREVDTGTLIVHPAAVYDIDGEVCTFLRDVDPQGVAFTDQYCMLRIGTSITWLYAESPTFAPDETQTRTTEDSISSEASETRLQDVDEDTAESLAMSLQAPAGLVLYGGLPGGEDFNTPPKWMSDGGCTIDVGLGGNSAEWLVFATEKMPADVC